MEICFDWLKCGKMVMLQGRDVQWYGVTVCCIVNCLLFDVFSPSTTRHVQTLSCAAHNCNILVDDENVMYVFCVSYSVK